MSGKSHLAMHPYMEQLMRALDCENLTEMSSRTGLGLKVLRDLAYYNKFEGYSVAVILQLAKATGESVESLAQGFQKQPVLA